MATGKWPMIINAQSGLSPGNHSVVITARDILGLTADATLNYLLEEEERTRQNRTCNQYTSTIPIYNEYIVGIMYNVMIVLLTSAYWPFVAIV